MRDLDDAALERRLRTVLNEQLGALPLNLTVDALDRRREDKGVARRFGRDRGMTLLAAAALLVVGGALATASGFLRLSSVVPPLPAPSYVAVATTSPDATSPSPSGSATPSANPIPVAGPGGVWIPTGSMTTPRRSHTAVRLLDGRVLVIAGNSVTGDDLTSAELYDPATGTWTATAKMIGDGGGTGLLLRDGMVLVAGDPAQLYDPATGTWTATAKMVNGADFVDAHATKTLLGDGKVLAVSFSYAQLYDPGTRAWTATGAMLTQRYRHMATLLPDGRVLAAGGLVAPEKPTDPADGVPTDSAELYDPDTGTWTAIANMKAPHARGTATQLRDGKVLVYDGRGWEVYDPATGTWTAGAWPTEFGSPRAVLSDDAVLFAPIGNNPDGCIADALFDPRTGSLTTISSMLRCGFESSFTLLLDGTVLKAGGRDCVDTDCGSAHTSAELYIPAGVPMPPLPAFPSPIPPALPSPTPRPTPLPPASGPVPPNARAWKVTVDNKSSEPAAPFVADADGDGLRVVGSATPNVVPAGATVKVTFLFPAKPDGGWIYVNPRPGDGGSLVDADQIGIPGKIVIPADGQEAWASP